MNYVLQDEDDPVVEAHSISVELDYPGVESKHSYWKEISRAEYYSLTTQQALEAFKRLSQLERIIPALKTAYALAKPAAGFAYLENLFPISTTVTRCVKR